MGRPVWISDVFVVVFGWLGSNVLGVCRVCCVLFRVESFLGSIVEIPHVSDIRTMLRIPNAAHGDMEWTKFVLKELSEPVWPPCEPLLTLVERLENIVQNFHVHVYLWTELDIRMRDVHYAWNDISAWPLDVWNPLSTDTERIYIGSLKCACNLDQIRDIYGSRVTTVVSMLQWSEMRVRGAPYDWDDYFAHHGARQYVYPLDDVAPKTPLLKAQQTKMCLHTWLKVCFQLWSLRRSSWQQGPLVVLFHCFGGRNRSTAAACAWLIIGHGFTAETAICHVLGPKRSLRPRKNRAYVPLGLLLLQ